MLPIVTKIVVVVVVVARLITSSFLLDLNLPIHPRTSEELSSYCLRSFFRHIAGQLLISL